LKSSKWLAHEATPLTHERHSRGDTSISKVQLNTIMTIFGRRSFISVYGGYGEREHTLGDWGESRSTVELIDNNNNTNNTALVVCQL